MKKITYIGISQGEANKKIWDSLPGKYQPLKHRSRLLAYLWLVVSGIAYGFVAVISWFSCLTVLFKDTRYSLHYMQTVIRINTMTNEQANNCLDSMRLEYKKHLSHGNIPLKKQSSIEATLELLYNVYKLPEASDEKHLEVISRLLDIKQVVDDTNGGMKTASNKIDVISTYTGIKLQEESQLKEKQVNQAKRIHTARQREKGKGLDSFLPNLSDNQLLALSKYCNRIPVFDRDIGKTDIEHILNCSHSQPLRVHNNKHVGLLFGGLAKKRLICRNWMAVSEKKKCFSSKLDNPISAKGLSTAISNSSTISLEAERLIEECIAEIAKAQD
jgi:hypothetical protein